jgi:hypothetical protein
MMVSTMSDCSVNEEDICVEFCKTCDSAWRCKLPMRFELLYCNTARRQTLPLQSGIKHLKNSRCD